MRGMVTMHSGQHLEEDVLPILCKELQIGVAALKKEMSAGNDNIPAERFQAGWETMIDVLTITSSGKQEINRLHDADYYYTPKKSNLSSARTTELSAASVIGVKACVKSSRKNSNLRLKRLFLKNRLGSEPR